MSLRDERRNAEGYIDPTAYEAIKNAESKERAEKLIYVLKYIIKHSSFELIERIHIRDKKTGREYH